MAHTGIIRMALTGAMALILVAGLGQQAHAQKDTIKLREPGNDKQAQEFAKQLGIAYVKAAHGTAREPALMKHDLKKDDKTAVLTLDMAYFGAIKSSKEYKARIRIEFDTSDPTRWEIKKVDYKDIDNKIRANDGNIKRLTNKLNGKS